jgi:hypothetical protein
MLLAVGVDAVSFEKLETNIDLTSLKLMDMKIFFMKMS